MNTFKKDTLIRFTFMLGLYSFIAGEYIIANVLFASAAIATQVDLTKRRE